MQFGNHTDLVRAEAFILNELTNYQTEFPRNRKLGNELNLHLKWADLKHDTNAGNFRYRDFFVSCRVNRRNQYPLTITEAIGTQRPSSNDFAFDYVFDEETCDSPDEVMVWITFHELWHFLCITRQKTGNYQTRANAFGFEMLRKFRSESEDES